MSTNTTVIVTGGDAAFFAFIRNAVKSLLAVGLDADADIAVLDQGLRPEQVAELLSLGCRVAQATWVLDVPEALRKPTQIGLVARTALREYFPGYGIYLWFDADAWAQTREFYDSMTQGARTTGAALVRENGRGYRRHALYSRWWYGHMLRVCGPVTGFRIAKKPAINIGVMALAANAPHWDAWRVLYERFIRRCKRVNLDQHAFNAAVEIYRLPYTLVSSRCNWIPRLSVPTWNADQSRLHEPAGAPLSVVHLAGPDKHSRYRLECVSGEAIGTSLTYDAFRALQLQYQPGTV
jgi:hypothetical protein